LTRPGGRPCRRPIVSGTAARGRRSGTGAADVETLDVEGGLDQIPGQLPAGAYILYVEDLTGDRNVHWTRWPTAFRPGFGGG